VWLRKACTWGAELKASQGGRLLRPSAAFIVEGRVEADCISKRTFDRFRAVSSHVIIIYVVR
jgi:hypothetical protein